MTDHGALATLLDDELACDATTSDRLSNHLPMALVALSRLGATDDRLAGFAARYQHRLAPIPSSEPIATFDEWLAARGRDGAYGALREYLERCVAADGVDATVRRHLPHLIDGLSGAAFHGIIRLAYALDAASGPRVAAGLAYLTEVHQPLGPRGVDVPRTEDPVVALAAVAERASGGAPRTRTIGERLRLVAAQPTFTGVADWLATDETTPSRLCAAAAALYAATDDFIALHGLTGSHAALVLAPFVEDRAALCAWWFQALAAAYLAIGAPDLADPSGPVAPWLDAPAAWPTIAAAATTSDDEHVVNLVYTARTLDERRPDPLLRAAASRQAGLAPDPR